MIIKFNEHNQKYKLLSNWCDTPVTIDGRTFRNAEGAWQSLKTDKDKEKDLFVGLKGQSARTLGRLLKLREDWDLVKYDLMKEVLYQKFMQNTQAKEVLLSTGDSELIEDTTYYCDNLWGNCDCTRCKKITGQNLLGKALMEVREAIKNQEEQ